MVLIVQQCGPDNRIIEIKIGADARSFCCKETQNRISTRQFVVLHFGHGVQERHKYLLSGAGSLVHVDHPVKAEPCLQIFLGYRHTLRAETEAVRFVWIMVINSNCFNLQAVEQPITIDMPRLNAGLLPVSLDVVEPVGVKLTGNDGGVDVAPICSGNPSSTCRNSPLTSVASSRMISTLQSSCVLFGLFVLTSSNAWLNGP